MNDSKAFNTNEQEAIKIGRDITQILASRNAGVGNRLALHAHGFSELPITVKEVHVYGSREASSTPKVHRANFHITDLEFAPEIANNGVKILAFGDCVRILIARVASKEADYLEFEDLANIHKALRKGMIDRILAICTLAGDIDAKQLTAELARVAEKAPISPDSRKYLRQLSQDLNLFHALSNAAAAEVEVTNSKENHARAEREAAARAAALKKKNTTLLSMRFLSNKDSNQILISAVERLNTALKNEKSARSALNTALRSVAALPNSRPALNIGMRLSESTSRQFQRSDQFRAYEQLVRNTLPAFLTPAPAYSTVPGAAPLADSPAYSVHPRPSYTGRSHGSGQPSRATPSAPSRH